VATLEPPTLIIVGEVVQLQSNSACFTPAPASVAVVAAG
jgi:hypothetical protein